MSNDETAIRWCSRLLQLTQAGKITWKDAGSLGPWGDTPGRLFKASVDNTTFAQIAEIPVPGLTNSYYFGVAEGNPEIHELSLPSRPQEFFRMFAEGFPAEPTDEKSKVLDALRELYMAAQESVLGTKQKVERFDQILERLA